MILVDALYINDSGGLVLLEYLIAKLEETNAKVFYLLDERIKIGFKSIAPNRQIFLKASLKNRLSFYLKSKNKYENILCFGNIPPPIKTKAEVYTYFHNVLYFEQKIHGNRLTNLVFKLKKYYINKTKQNTDFWIVQTDPVKKNLQKNFSLAPSNILIKPFFKFNVSRDFNKTRINNSFIYVSNSYPHKNHKILLHTWERLIDSGFYYPLHLTIPKEEKQFEEIIETLNKKGGNIVNHGLVDQSELVELYSVCEYLVYPSLKESFGLGLIEGGVAGCKIIASDLPYVYEVVRPHEVFNPYDIDSMIESIKRAMTNHEDLTKVLVKNNIDDIIKLLCLKTKPF